MQTCTRLSAALAQTVDFDAVLALLSELEQEAVNADCNSTLK